MFQQLSEGRWEGDISTPIEGIEPPKNGGLEIDFPVSIGWFSGSVPVFFGSTILVYFWAIHIFRIADPYKYKLSFATKDWEGGQHASQEEQKPLWLSIILVV